MKDEENSSNNLDWKNRWLVAPEQPYRFLWEMFIFLVLIILGILLPYITAFEPDNDALSQRVDIFTIVIFSTDIIINFNTGYYVKGILIMNRTQIFKNYLKFWFWLDLLSTLPLDWVLETAGSSTGQTNKILKYIRIIRVLKLVRLIRLTKLKFMIIKIQDRISNKKVLTLITVIKLMLYLFLIANFFACIMFSVSSEDMTPGSFISEIVNRTDKPDYDHLYASCLYWAFVTMACIGYGDISPQTSTERVFGVLTMLISSFTFGFIIGNIGTVISKHSAKERQRRETLVNLNQLIKKYNLGPELTAKTRKYMDFAFLNEEKDNIQLSEMLRNLSQPLQDEIMMYTNGSLISKCPVFSNFSKTFVHRFSRILVNRIFSPSDILIREGEEPKGMFFITRGMVEVFDNYTRCKIEHLTEGQHVGEIGLFTMQPCVASVAAAHFVSAFHLKCADFYKITDQHYKVKEMIAEMRMSCVEGNYTALHIKCYMCRKIGHIARNCDEIMNNERAKRIWIRRKENSKEVNLMAKLPLVYKRNGPKKTHRRDYSVKNVIGAKRAPREMFPKAKRLVRGIIGYLKLFRQEAAARHEVVLITEESSVSNCTRNVFRHPEWILSSDEEDSEEGEYLIRDKTFNIGLLK
jgi:hypothetical protein